MWIALGLVLVVFAARVALNPVARYFTRRALNSSQQLSGTFSDLGVSLPRLTYWIDDLSIRERSSPRASEPLFYAKRVVIALSARDLFHRHLVGHINLDRPKLAFAPSPEPAKTTSRTLFCLRDALLRSLPFRLDRLQVVDGQFLYVAKGTGVPDRETIKELGLDPDELIRNPSTNSSGSAANEPTKAPSK